MRLTDEVAWDGFDVAAGAALLFGACSAWELAARTSGSVAYRAAVGIAIVAAVLLVWINLAVGIIGAEDDPANWMFGGVLAIGAVGVAVARLQAGGMAHAMVAMAIAQVAAGTVALAARWGSEAANWPWTIVVLTGFFAASWLVAAWLFRKAVRLQPAGRAAA